VAARVDGEKKLLAAFQLADEAVELGIIQKEQKHAFVAQLEAESFEEIQARRSTIEMVRTAGLTRRSLRQPVARKIPRLASTNDGKTTTTALIWKTFHLKPSSTKTRKYYKLYQLSVITREGTT
jgi:hypothetical protein